MYHVNFAARALHGLVHGSQIVSDLPCNGIELGLTLKV